MQPLLVTGSVITVEHFEYEGGRDAGQRVDVVWLDLESLLIEVAGANHRLRRRGSIGDHLATHDKVGGVAASWPLAFVAPGLDISHPQADCSSQTADDFVLNLQRVVSLDIETFGPNLPARLRVDELGIHA